MKRSVVHSKSLALLFGILTAAVIVCTQTVQYSYQPISSELEHAEAADEEGQTHVSMHLSDAVSSYAQITLDQALHELSSIYMEVKDRVEIPVEQKLNFNSLFKTLFRLIISPNAP